MSHAAWNEVLHRALVLFGTEPIQIRIFAGLAAAFAAVMILEGMRFSFLPAGWLRPRPHDVPVALQPKKKVSLARVESAATNAFDAKVAGTAARRPFRPCNARHNCTPKLSKGVISRHRAERPKIRRISKSAFSASFAPPADSAPR